MLLQGELGEICPWLKLTFGTRWKFITPRGILFWNSLYVLGEEGWIRLSTFVPDAFVDGTSIAWPL